MRMLGSFLWVLLLVPASAWAAAWTLPEGHWQYIQNIIAYSTTTYFDKEGSKQNQPRYTRYELNPYAEMGWREGTTIGAMLSLDAVEGSDLRTRQQGTNIGISDPSVFLRQRLWQGERMVFSVQPLLKLPSYFVDENIPRSGSEQIDAELRFLAGASFPLFGREHFANLEVAYRHRLGAPKDQLRADATIGMAIADNWYFLPQIFYTESTGSINASNFTQTPQDDFQLLKPQLSFTYQPLPYLTLQAGAFSHLRGKNTGAGEGIMFSAWVTP